MTDKLMITDPGKFEFRGSNKQVIQTIDVVIPQIIVHINKDYYQEIASQANSLGFGFNDAGPNETIRRLLIEEGLSFIDALIKDPADGYRVTKEQIK